MFEGITLTLMAGGRAPADIDLAARGRSVITFGRHPDNDVRIDDPIASNYHGRLEWSPGGVTIVDALSTNGIFIDGVRVEGSAPLSPGDAVTFESDAARAQRGGQTGVLMLLSGGTAQGGWSSCPVGDRAVTLGSAPECGLRLLQPGVLGRHARVALRDGTPRIERMAGDVFLGRAAVERDHALRERDLIRLGTATVVYAGGRLYYHRVRPGVVIEARGLTRSVPVRGSQRVILEPMDFTIARGTFTAIIGGSGAGKSTLMNALCGFQPATAGVVRYDGLPLLENYESLKALIGYVPQQDIVHRDLTLAAMLGYAARMRMPPDATEQERRERVERVVKMVELQGREDTPIGRLSGGQRKRASIAVELVSDPAAFFLDEPTSGLDPGTERNLMRTLHRMSRSDKTIVVVTHMTANIALCDALVVLGPGGKLCFCGPPREALAFFGVEEYVDIYDKIAANPAGWQLRFSIRRGDAGEGPGENAENAQGAAHSGQARVGADSGQPRATAGIAHDARAPNPPTPPGPPPRPPHPPKAGRTTPRSFGIQLRVLVQRYAALIAADRKRLMLLFLQAPLLGALLGWVSRATDATGRLTTYIYGSQSQSLLFSLSCAAFWVGMLGAVQEICKERDILGREHMAGIGLAPYLLSKLIVLGGFCAAQSLLLVAAVALVLGMPATVLLPAFPGMALVAFLTAFSAAMLGLLVSALSPTPDRAMTLAPIALMPQILFSGVAFELSGIADLFSGIISCKWSVRALCTLVDINALPLNDQSASAAFQSVAYTPSFHNLFTALSALLAIAAVCAALCAAALYAAHTND